MPTLRVEKRSDATRRVEKRFAPIKLADYRLRETIDFYHNTIMLGGDYDSLNVHALPKQIPVVNFNIHFGRL